MSFPVWSLVPTRGSGPSHGPSWCHYASSGGLEGDILERDRCPGILEVDPFSRETLGRETSPIWGDTLERETPLEGDTLEGVHPVLTSSASHQIGIDPTEMHSCLGKRHMSIKWTIGDVTMQLQYNVTTSYYDCY